MKHYSQQELDAKIHAFLTEKHQRYSELDNRLETIHPTIEPSVSARLIESVGWFKPSVAH